jgi:hypothetical protein
MKESKKESTSIEMKKFTKKTDDTVIEMPDDSVIEMPNDTVIEMPDDSGELQSVSIHSQEQEVEASLEILQTKLDSLIQRNDQFLANPPKIADNKVKEKKGFKEKTAAFLKANDYTHFDVSVEKRKLLTRDILQETLQKDLDTCETLRREITSSTPIDEKNKKLNQIDSILEQVTDDIEKLELFLNSSDIALDFEIRKSNGELTKKESAKSLIQGKEHMRAILVRSLAQSMISATSGTALQVGAAAAKEKAFNAMVNQLTKDEADQVVEEYLDGLTENSNSEITTTSEPEITATIEMDVISDEALVSVTEAITTSEAAKFSGDLCESLLDHIESLETLPDTLDELKQVANNFLNGEIERLGDRRSFSHNFIGTMKKCVDFSTEIKGVVKPDSPYYDASELTYSEIVIGDFMIGMMKGTVLPIFDTMYEKGKESRKGEEITSEKKKKPKLVTFRDEVSKSMKNQAKGIGATLALVFLIKAASGKITFDAVGKDVTFNALSLATVGTIDGVRSLSSCGETCSQAIKATLRTFIGRGIPQVVKSYISRGKEFTKTEVAVTTDTLGVIFGGALKEVNGALWQRSANNPDGYMNSWAGKASFHETDLLKAYKKRADSNPTVRNFLKEMGEVDKLVAKSDKYINQIDPSLTAVISVPSVSQNLPSSGATGVTAGATGVTAGATNATAGATGVTAGATNATAGATNAKAGATNATAEATNATAGATNAKAGATNATAEATNATAQATQLKSLKEQQQKLDTEIAKIQATQLKSLKEQQQKLDTEIEKIQKSKKDPKISEEQKKSFKQQEKSLETRRTEIRQQRDILSPPTTSNTDKIVTTAEVYPTRKFDATKFKSSSITPNPNGARPKQGPKQSPKQGPKQSPKPGRK